MDETNDTSETKEAENSKTSDYDSKLHRKGHKWLWVLLVVMIIFITPVIALAYFGFVPGVSNLIGANKPRDLGVRYTAANYISFEQKSGLNFIDFANAPNNPNKPGKKIVFADPKPQNITLTQEEITAAINSVGWELMPIKNAQVRLTEDTVEISGNLNINKIVSFVNFIGGVGYSQTDIDKAMSWGKRLISDAPVYIKGNGGIVSGQLQVKIVETKIGRFSAPIDIANKVLSTGTSNALSNTPGLNTQTTKIQNGQLSYIGTYPTTVYVKH